MSEVSVPKWLFWSMVMLAGANTGLDMYDFLTKEKVDSEKFKTAKTKVTNLKHGINNRHINSETLVLSPEDFAQMQQDINFLYSVLQKQDDNERKTDSLNIESAKAKRQAKNR
ncbi:MAG: hypothetical protein LBF37_04375 [Rickettsiales bacterium]|jgi:hypothetical protein|nr:hypothetical protein [Rickettsiales bacterium]